MTAPLSVVGSAEPWVNAQQVAEHTGFSADWVRDRWEDGTLRSAGFAAGKKGSRLRFKLSLVDEALLTRADAVSTLRLGQQIAAKGCDAT